MKKKHEKTPEVIKQYYCKRCFKENQKDCYRCYNSIKGDIECLNYNFNWESKAVGHFIRIVDERLHGKRIFSNIIPNGKAIPNVFKNNPLRLPVWKYLDDNGWTLVVGIMPRIALGYFDIYLFDCMDEFNCIEVNSDIVKEFNEKQKELIKLDGI